MQYKFICAVDDDPDYHFLFNDAIDKINKENNINIEIISITSPELFFQEIDKVSYPIYMIILIDINMPQMNGFELIESIKNTKELSCVPIIIISSSQSEDDIERSYKIGANSFIKKPTDIDTLFYVIKSIINYWFEVCRFLPYQPTIQKPQD